MKYFPFESDSYKPKMGLAPLDLAEWIEIDEQRESQLALKASILRDHRDTVFQVQPEAEDGCLELREVLADHLARQFPRHFQLQGQSLETCGQLFHAPVSAAKALAQITVWTQEDWAILSSMPPVKLEAGSVCFPSRWSLKDKIGKDPAAIHGPVPRFASIARPTQSFLERLTVDKPMWRLNWTIHDSDQLFCPGPHPSASDLNEANIIARCFTRVERQTLRRLPRSQAVIFSIRTYIHPLRETLKDPSRFQLLKEAVAGLDPETAAYKGMSDFHRILNSALAAL